MTQNAGDGAPPEELNGVFAAFESRTNLEKGLPPGNPNRIYRLDRMRVLCRAFGNPQDDFRSVHVAGSKGKGSVAAYLGVLLHAAGRRVGVYGSPHLVDYRERFRIEGQDFPEETALSVGRSLLERLPAVEKGLAGEGGATTFELLTLFAFLLFRECGCDTAVLEAGLGGRLDATNVVSGPEAVVFTPIEKEHTEILGTRIHLIAREKAGILKAGTRAWSAGQPPAAARVFRRCARKMAVPLTELWANLASIRQGEPTDGAFTGSTAAAHGEPHAFTWELTWKDGRRETVRLRMGGRVQAENAALALLTARVLEPLPTADALHEATLPGRFQWLRENPPVIIDGAHTPRSAAAVRDAFLEAVRGPASGAGRPPSPVLLFGCALGKDAAGMAKALCGGRRPAFREVIVSTPGTFKPSDPKGVAETFRKTGADTALVPDPSEAWLLALEKAGGDRPLLVTGSFYMAGEIAARGIPK